MACASNRRLCPHMDRSSEYLLMAAILQHFGDEIHIGDTALEEAQFLGGYRVIDEAGLGVTIKLVHNRGRVQATD
jgi:hypothetical protein